ncbi:MAG TPA: alpha/beta fold hydrolase, partial [Thermoanaerobaculia bacterium]
MASLLTELRSRDIEVWVEGDQLRCNAPAGVLTPDLRDLLRLRKGDMIDFLRAAQAVARQQRAIVPLQQRGSRAPIFAVPGHNGDVFLYRALAQHLGNDQPFFGLQLPGLEDHSEPLTSVEDLAAYFAAQICEFRPHGPYVIAGYCAGGTIAFELARQLLQQGADVDFLVLFAGGYPTWYRFIPQLRERATLRMKRLRNHLAVLASLSNRERRLYIMEKLRRRSESHLTAVDPVLALRARLKQITARAVSRYTPRDFAGRFCQILPSNGCVLPRGATLPWRTVVPQLEEYCGPDGCEGDVMLLEPH